MITHGPLAWPLIAACDYGELGLDPEHAAACEQAAGEWLWQATAARFGLRTAVWRPQFTPAGPGAAQLNGGLEWAAAGAALAGPLGVLGVGCGTAAATGLLRMPPPVDSVTAVTVDGTALPTSAYRLEGNVLRRLDGKTWPTSQDVTLAATAPGTWQVAYVRGRDVPAGGRRAAGLLACELGKRLTGDKKCVIPANAVTVSRNGTTINIDRNALQGLTNIAEVDQWIRLVNPRGLQRRPQVFSPDSRPAIR